MSSHERRILTAPGVPAIMVALWLAIPARTACAQQASDPDTSAQPTLTWSPSFGLTSLGYDSNVFYQADNPQSDVTATVTGELKPRWQAARADVTGDVRGDYRYFKEFPGERGLDFLSRGGVSMPLSLGKLRAGGSYSNTRQRMNFDVDERVRWSEYTLSTGYDLPLGDRFTAMVDFARTAVDINDNGAPDTAQLEQRLNRTERSIGSSLEYAVTPLTSVAAAWNLTENRFPLAPERDGRRTRLGSTLTLDPDALVSGRAAIFWERLTIAVPGSTGFDGPTMVADLATHAGRTVLGFHAGRAVTFSSDAISPYYVETGVSASLSQGLGDRWTVAVRGQHALLDYAQPVVGEPTRDQERVNVVGGEVRFRFTNGLEVGLHLESTDRQATLDPARSFTARRIFTSISQPIGF